MKMTLKISPTFDSLNAKDIRKFMNVQIGNQTINMTNIKVSYKDGIV